MKLIITIFFIACFLNSSGQLYKFEGIVRAAGGKTLSEALVISLHSGDSIKTDVKGYFSFTSVEPRDMLVEIKKRGFRLERLYLSRTTSGESLSQIELCKLCKYDSAARICPICKLDDKVVNIVYGLPLPPFRVNF